MKSFDTRGPLRWPLLAAYAAPGLAMALMTLPFPALLTTFYAKYTEATTAGIATVMLFCRIFNGVIDPFIGYASDATNSRFGPRKPWLAAGALLSIPAFLLAYMPPTDAGNGYLFVAMVVFYLSLSAIEIPLRSWLAEISTDYAQRSRLSAAITLTLLVGGVLFMSLPEILKPLGWVESSRMDRPMMALFGWIGVVLLPLGMAAALWLVPVGAVMRGHRYTVRDMLRTVLHNRPFQLFLAADWLIGVSWGVTYALLFIALDNYLGFGDRIGLLLLVATAAQIAVLPLCISLASRWGKHMLWAYATLATAATGPLMLLFPPGGQASAVLVFMLMAVVSMLSTPQMFVPAALISDLSDYGTYKTGQAQTGTYYAIRSLIFPASGAVGTSLAFFAMAAVGYEPAAKANSESATQGMLWTLALLPAVLSLVSGLMLLRYPINRRRHQALRSRIERRETLRFEAP
ncbi:MFS transporter [Rubrivivax albus]|nr:MFS transporter [Rubrivivax albus]